MSSTNTAAVTSLPFVAARGILNTVDKVIDPLCCVPILATPPRIVQIAINTLGLVGAASGGVAASAASIIPLPGAAKRTITVWNNDAWKLSSELSGKIGRLAVDAIPFAGPRTLRRLDAAVANSARLTKEYADLRATSLTLSSEKDQLILDNGRLREQNRGLTSNHAQVHVLTSARKALEQRAAEREQELQRLVEEKKDQEKQAAMLRTQTEGLQERLRKLSQQIQDLTSQLEEKQKVISGFEHELGSSQRELEKSEKALIASRSLEERLDALSKQREELASQQAALEDDSARTAQHIESLMAQTQ